MTTEKILQQGAKLWPRLADFPSTNALMALGVVMWLATCAVALVLACFKMEIPGSWYSTLNLFTGTVVIQFGVKRFSDSSFVEARTAGKALAAGLLSGAPAGPRTSSASTFPVT